METNIYDTEILERDELTDSKDDLNVFQTVAMTVVAIIAVTLGTIYGSIL